MGWLVCRLSTARPVMRGPVVRTQYIYRRPKSLPNPKDTYNSHIQFSEKFFLRSVRGILINLDSSRVNWEKILRSFSLQVFIDSASKRRQQWIPNQVCNFSFSPLKLCFVFYHGDLG